MYKRYHRILGKEVCKTKYNELLDREKWSFIGKSNGEQIRKFWHLNLMDDEFFTKFFLDKIKDITQRNFELKRVYANGQSAGQSGDWHQDDVEENTYTFIYYLNPIWQPIWCGDTIFYDSVTEETCTSEFIPDSAILFDSRIIHAGREPARQFDGLRVTVAFKLLEKTSEKKEK